MALDGSTDSLDRLESNGIVAYIDPNLNAYMKKLGGVSIDYVVTPDGAAGYTIRAGQPPDPQCGGCTSC